MRYIDLKRYFVEKEHKTGRPPYDKEKLLKVVLFALMENGYEALRKMEQLCKVDIRFLWLEEKEEIDEVSHVSKGDRGQKVSGKPLPGGKLPDR